MPGWKCIPQRLKSFALPRQQAQRGILLILVLAILPGVTGWQASAQLPQTSGPRFVVLLDAAHGGDDSGAALGNQPEKAITLALSVRLRSLLMARGIGVVTTRESDASVDPDRRAEIANRANAAACLSLHATEAGSGIHLFVSSLAPADSVRFAAWKTAQAAWVTRSLALAGVINSALGQAGMTVTLERTNLSAVDSMSCPAVAIEVAPQRSSGNAGAVNLDDPSLQAHIAEALAAALVEWRSEYREGRQP